MSELKNLEYFQKVIAGGGDSLRHGHFEYPPPIAKTLGLKLIEIGAGTAVMEMQTDMTKHANPMGTLHGGILGDIADAAIGTAHAASLVEGESFTSVDLQVNFFRPVWNDTLRAVVKPIHPGKTVSRYVCDVFQSNGKLAAQITSTVMTLRGQQAQGR